MLSGVNNLKKCNMTSLQLSTKEYKHGEVTLNSHIYIDVEEGVVG